MTTNSRHPDAKKERKARVLELATTNPHWTNVDIARAVGISPNAVGIYAREFGDAWPPRGRTAEPDPFTVPAGARVGGVPVTGTKPLVVRFQDGRMPAWKADPQKPTREDLDALTEMVVERGRKARELEELDAAIEDTKRRICE